jgi:hypothetical protein
LDDDEVQDIVRELRSDLEERVAKEGSPTPEAVQAALKRLGDPNALAAEFVAGMELVRHVRGFSFAGGLGALVKLASASVLGLFTCLIVGASYLFSGSLVVLAFVKVVQPKNTGVFLGTGTFSVGWLSNPQGLTEMLGWWFVPLALGGGALLAYATTRALAFWSNRRWGHFHSN